MKRLILILGCLFSILTPTIGEDFYNEPYLGNDNGRDLLIIIDASASLFVYRSQITDYITREFFPNEVSLNDTVHLFSFSDVLKIELSRLVYSESDITAIFTRLYSILPLERHSNITSIFSDLKSFLEYLPQKRDKKILLITDEAINNLIKDTSINNSPSLDDELIKYLTSELAGNTVSFQIVILPITNTLSHQLTASQSRIPSPKDLIHEPIQLAEVNEVTETTETTETVETLEAELIDYFQEELPGELPEEDISYDSISNGTTLSQKPISTAEVDELSEIFEDTNGVVAEKGDIKSFLVQVVKSRFFILALISIIIIVIVVFIIILWCRRQEKTIRTTKPNSYQKETALPTRADTIGKKENLHIKKKLSKTNAIKPNKKIVKKKDLPIKQTSINKISPYYKKLNKVVKKERLMVKLWVKDQNENIGKRNTHILKAGRKLSLGGKNSDFLIFLVPFPRRIADFWFNGDQSTLVIKKAAYFPNDSEIIPDCLGKTLTVVSSNGHELQIRLEEYEDPLLILNRLLHSIDQPG